jgi:phage baseplate assembly protein W
MSVGNEVLTSWWAERTAEVDPTLAGVGVLSAWWSFGLSDGIVQNADDIEQCLAIIAQVPHGNDPHRPGFASQVHKHLDKPIPEAAPFVIRELITAVRQWELRIKLDSLRLNAYEPSIAALTVRAEWSLAGVSREVDISIKDAYV